MRLSTSREPGRNPKFHFGWLPNQKMKPCRLYTMPKSSVQPDNRALIAITINSSTNVQYSRALRRPRTHQTHQTHRRIAYDFSIIILYSITTKNKSRALCQTSRRLVTSTPLEPLAKCSRVEWTRRLSYLNQTCVDVYGKITRVLVPLTSSLPMLSFAFASH